MIHTPQSAGGPKRLPIVIINGRRYFKDERLREYRNVEDIDDRIPIPFELGSDFQHLFGQSKPDIEPHP